MCCANVIKSHSNNNKNQLKKYKAEMWDEISLYETETSHVAYDTARNYHDLDDWELSSTSINNFPKIKYSE